MPEIRVSNHALIVSSMQQPNDMDPIRLLEQMQSGKVLPLPEPDRLTVLTGIYGGPVQVQAEFLDTRPEEILNGWEDIEEYSMTLGPGPAVLSAHEEMPVVVGKAFENGPLCHRVRVHAKGRDSHYDLITDEVVESYSIQFWPELYAEPILVKAGSIRGLELFENNIRLQ